MVILLGSDSVNLQDRHLILSKQEGGSKFTLWEKKDDSQCTQGIYVFNDYCPRVTGKSLILRYCQ